jgi:hypothetical protein
MVQDGGGDKMHPLHLRRRNSRCQLRKIYGSTDSDLFPLSEISFSA